MKEDTQQGMTLRDILRVIFRHKLIILMSCAVVTGSVYIGLNLRTPLYESQVKVLVAGKMQKDLDVERSLGPGSLISTQMALVTSKPIIDRTVEALKLYQRPLDYEKKFASKIKGALVDYMVDVLKSEIEGMTEVEKKAFLFNNAAGNLMGNIATWPLGETSIFVIKVQDYNANAAGRIANVLSRAYIIFDLEQQIAELQLTYGRKNETIQKLEKHIEDLEETLDGRILPDIEALGPASVKIITQAGSGIKVQMRPTKASGMIAGFIMGITLGCILSFAFDYFDQTFKSPQELERFLKIPYLGSIPKVKKINEILKAHHNPTTRYTQSFQKLCNRIYVFMKDGSVRSLLLTDVGGTRKNTSIVANLGAVSARRTGCKVLIIDANLREPSIHKLFNISNSPGLLDVLGSAVPLEMAIYDTGSNVAVLPAGEAVLNPGALLESPEMSNVIKRAEEIYDLVFINCADIKNYSDAVILSPCAGGIVFLIEEGKVSRQVVKHAIYPLEEKQANVIGAVLYNHKYVIPEIIYRLT